MSTSFVDDDGTTRFRGRLVGGAAANVVRVRVPFTPATPGIATGVALYTPGDGDVVTFAAIEVVTAWDGTSPIGSVFPADANPGEQDLVAADLTTPETGLGAGWVSFNNSSASGFASLATTPLILNAAQAFASITGLNQGAKTFTVAGDQVAFYNALTLPIWVRTSTGNDGAYTVVSAALNAGDTDIVVAEAIPDNTVDGIISPGGDAGSATGAATALLVIATAA